MGWISESKQCDYKSYGLYCNSMRKQGFIPLSYDEWKSSGCLILNEK